MFSVSLNKVVQRNFGKRERYKNFSDAICNTIFTVGTVWAGRRRDEVVKKGKEDRLQYHKEKGREQEQGMSLH